MAALRSGMKEPEENWGSKIWYLSPQASEPRYFLYPGAVGKREAFRPTPHVSKMAYSKMRLLLVAPERETSTVKVMLDSSVC